MTPRQPFRAGCVSIAFASLFGTEAFLAQTPAGQSPPPPPGTKRVLSFDRRGNQVAVCAEKAGEPIVKGSRRIPPTEVWYMNGQVVRRTALGLGVCEPVWSPDGRRLAVTAPDGLWVLSDVFLDKQDTGERLVDAQPADRPATESGDLAFSKPSWSPDGTRLAYVASNAGTSWTEVVDVASGRRLFKSDPGVVSFIWSPDSRSLQIAGKSVRIP